MLHNCCLHYQPHRWYKLKLCKGSKMNSTPHLNLLRYMHLAITPIPTFHCLWWMTICKKDVQILANIHIFAPLVSRSAWGTILLQAFRKHLVRGDLCNDNVLLRMSSSSIPLAKISKFGMSKLVDPDDLNQSLTTQEHRSVSTTRDS